MKSISKEHISIIQLRAAIRLFSEKDFISAITLASAAEEIMARLSDESLSRKLKRPVKNNYADNSAALVARFIPNSEIDLSKLTEEETEAYYNEIESQFIADRNKIRNKLKHNNKGEKEVRFTTFKKIAMTHIAGAITNYKLMKGKLPNEKIILEFCKEVGVS